MSSVPPTDGEGGPDIDALFEQEIDAVLSTMKIRSAEELNLTEQDFEQMRARGSALLGSLSADINASYANISAVIAERIATGMAEQRVSALNDYNQRTASLQREVRDSQRQVREDMQRVSKLQAELEGGGSSGTAERAGRSASGVAIALGVYNGGVNVWHGLQFPESSAQDFSNAGGDALLIIAGTIGFLLLSRQRPPDDS